MPQPASPWYAIDVTLPEALPHEADQANVDLFRAVERRRRWLEENREAIASFNDYVELNSLPLSRFRQF